MAAALRDHLTDDALGQMEESAQVHRGDRDVVLERVVREGLADEHTGIVDQAVDPSESTEGLLHHLRSGPIVGDVTSEREVVVLFDGFDGA